MPDLPWPVHFISQAPVLHVVRFLHAMLAPQVAPFRSAFHVAIFQQRRRLLRRSRSKIHSQQRRCARPLAPRHEFIQSELIRLHRIPGFLHQPRPLFLRSHPVQPVVSRDEIPARIPHDRHTYRLHFFHPILAEPVRVRQLRSRLVNSLVDRPPQVFKERSKNVAIDRPNRPSSVQIDLRRRGSRTLRPCLASQPKICRNSGSRHHRRFDKLSPRFHRFPSRCKRLHVAPAPSACRAILYTLSCFSSIFFGTTRDATLYQHPQAHARIVTPRAAISPSNCDTPRDTSASPGTTTAHSRFSRNSLFRISHLSNAFETGSPIFAKEKCRAAAIASASLGSGPLKIKWLLPCTKMPTISLASSAPVKTLPSWMCLN